MKKNQIKKYEVDLFNQLAFDGEYDLAPNELYSFILDFLASSGIRVKGELLEAGCGNGSFSKALFSDNKGLVTTGVDISPEMVKRANGSRSRNYTAIVGDLENNKLFKRNKFDAVLCSLILHHFPSIDNLLSNLDSWTKDDSFVIGIEPNGQNLTARISRLIRLMVEFVFGKEYLIKSKMATPNEVNHSFNEYQRVFIENNFEIVKCQYFYVEPNLKVDFSIGSLRTLFSRFLKLAFPNSKISMTNLIFVAKKRI